MILKAESERPSHSVDLILRIWTLAAELFREQISRGQEVSNNPKSTDMRSIYAFMTIIHGIVDPIAAHTNQTSIKKFRAEYKSFLKIVLNRKLFDLILTSESKIFTFVMTFKCATTGQT